MGAGVNHIEDPRLFKEPLIKSEVPAVQGHAAKTENCKLLILRVKSESHLRFTRFEQIQDGLVQSFPRTTENSIS